MLNTVYFIRFCTEYHRNGLDIMYEDNDKGRGYVTESIEDLRKLKANQPNSIYITIIF